MLRRRHPPTQTPSWWAIAALLALPGCHSLATSGERPDAATDTATDGPGVVPRDDGSAGDVAAPPDVAPADGGPPRVVVLDSATAGAATRSYLRALLDSAGVAYVELGAAAVTVDALRGRVVVAAFGDAPEDYRGAPAAAVVAAVRDGAWLLAEAFGLALLEYGGVGTTQRLRLDRDASCSQRSYFVAPSAAEAATPLFASAARWTPGPAGESADQLLAHYAAGAPTMTFVDYSPPAAGAALTRRAYWSLVVGCDAALQTNAWCADHPGVCADGRAVHEHRVLDLALGRGRALSVMAGAHTPPAGWHWDRVAATMQLDAVRWGLATLGAR